MEILLPEEVLTAVHMNNMGHFFEAHEVLELAWRAEKEPIREFYQALLWVSVMNYHAERGNLKGVKRLINRLLERLHLCKDVRTAINLRGLLASLMRLDEIVGCIPTDAPDQQQKIPVVLIPLN